MSDKGRTAGGILEGDFRSVRPNLYYKVHPEAILSGATRLCGRIMPHKCSQGSVFLVRIAILLAPTASLFRTLELRRLVGWRGLGRLQFLVQGSLNKPADRFRTGIKPVIVPEIFDSLHEVVRQ